MMTLFGLDLTVLSVCVFVPGERKVSVTWVFTFVMEADHEADLILIQVLHVHIYDD